MQIKLLKQMGAPKGDSGVGGMLDAFADMIEGLRKEIHDKHETLENLLESKTSQINFKLVECEMNI